MIAAAVIMSRLLGAGLAASRPSVIALGQPVCSFSHQQAAPTGPLYRCDPVILSQGFYRLPFTACLQLVSDKQFSSITYRLRAQEVVSK